MKGYLVVLKQPVRWDDRNPSYKGLSRAPAWGDRPEEAEATDAYVFGSYTDSSQGGLIPTSSLAQELYRLFSTSPRELEIIYAQTLDEPQQDARRDLLGFDVACVTPFWSIVHDWPPDKELEVYLSRLNDNGLFTDPRDAGEFLDKFRAAHPEEDEIDLFIWRIEVT
jgi:hypothetical protein